MRALVESVGKIAVASAGRSSFTRGEPAEV